MALWTRPGFGFRVGCVLPLAALPTCGIQAPQGSGGRGFEAVLPELISGTEWVVLEKKGL